MQEIVINKCYGGFGLSYKAIMRYAEIKGFKLYVIIDPINAKVWKQYGKENELIMGNEELTYWFAKKPINEKNWEKVWNKYGFAAHDLLRNDPVLVQVVKELKNKANGHCAKLEIIEIPDDVKEWEVGEYDGLEWVEEKTRKWQ